MQTSAKKACSQFAECSFSSAKIRLFLVTTKCFLGKMKERMQGIQKRGCVIKSVLYSFKARITRITRIFFREMIIALLILVLQIRVIRVIRALSISKEAYDTPSFCIWFTYKVYCYFSRYFKKSSIPMTSTLGKDIFSNSLKCLSSDTIKIALLAIAQSTNLLSSSSAFINPKL